MTDTTESQSARLQLWSLRHYLVLFDIFKPVNSGEKAVNNSCPQDNSWLESVNYDIANDLRLQLRGRLPGVTSMSSHIQP